MYVLGFTQHVFHFKELSLLDVSLIVVVISVY